MSTTKYRLKKKCASIETYCWFLYYRDIIYDLLRSNCNKTNVLKFTGKSTWLWECVRVLEIVATAKISILGEFISSEEIDYFTSFSNNSDVVSPNEVFPNSIFIFDNVACNKQDAIREYSAMSRHADVDCFYLCQMFAKIPKHLIRDNENLLILFKQDGTNLKHIWS